VAAAWPEPVERVSSFLREAGAEARIEQFTEGTPTASDAAAAVGCGLDQIVKSLVFVCDGKPVVALVPGDLRGDREKVAGEASAASARIASAEEVERATGFPPGAVAPFPLPEVDVVLLDVRERGQHHEPEDRHRRDAADRRAESERRRLQEAGARVRRERLLDRGDRRARGGAIGDRAHLRLDVGHLAAHVARHVARPQQPEDDREDGADQRDHPADHESEQQAGDSDREADRPEARPGEVRGVVAGIAQLGPAGDSTAPPSRLSTT